jgi:hypothetical protein
MAAPSMRAPGMTSFDPAAGPPKAMPQALAWNIGTTGRIVSLGVAPSTVVCRPSRVWMKLDRCEYSTPFGLPVVPDV